MTATVRSEAARKSVHIVFGAAALLLRWLTPLQALACALVAAAFNLLLLHRLTRGALLRSGERERRFSPGILLYPLVVAALIAVFHRRLELAAAVWGLLAFGDGMATVVGLWLGGPRLPWNPRKTWSGLAAFVLCGTVAAAVLIRWTQRGVLDAAGGDGRAAAWIGDAFLDPAAPAFLLAGCAVAAAAAALAESLDTGVDDNLVVPLVGGATLYAATLLQPELLVERADVLQPQLLWGLGVNVLLALAAYAVRAVSLSGALWGSVLGTALYTFGGWRGFLMLLVFFVLGTAATKLGWARKTSLGIAQESGGRRGAKHAFANTTTGVVFAFLAAATPFREACLLGMVAAFATAACDTVSSEVGQAFGKRHYLITNLRRVAAGTDGAVSLQGTLGGIVAAAIAAGVAWQVGLVSAAGAGMVVVAAFFGATLESYLGATLEAAGRIDNELVNFANTLAGALAAIGLLAVLT